VIEIRMGETKGRNQTKYGETNNPILEVTCLLKGGTKKSTGTKPSVRRKVVPHFKRTEK